MGGATQSVPTTADPMALGRGLVEPYGGHLTDLFLSDAEAPEARAYAAGLPQVTLSPRVVFDLDLLASGAFSPLNRFMGSADYRRVLDEMRLADGQLFPVPITFPVANTHGWREGCDVGLRDQSGEQRGILTVEEIYPWDRSEFAQRVLGTQDRRHPLVAELPAWGDLNVSGRLRAFRRRGPELFAELRLSPRETRNRLTAMGASRVVAFQTRNPLHRAHEELTKQAMAKVQGSLLLHPIAGLSKPNDVDLVARVRTYQHLVAHGYPRGSVLLALLPLAMRFAGPREALWHAVIRRNFGADHFIVGRSHACPGADSNGNPFYPPFAAQELLQEYAREIQVHPVFFDEMVYVPSVRGYREHSTVAPGTQVRSISGSEVREFLARGRALPAWYTRGETSRLLSAAYPPSDRRGVCIWMTGLSGAGKSAIAEMLDVLLLEHGRRSTLLDGDVVRTMLSSELGFSRKDRDTNVRRIGFVAAEVVRHGGVVIVAAISPYREVRQRVREAIGGEAFVEVHVHAPLEVCEQRDPKGLYAKARRGEITQFTGIDDPYESPEAPEIILDSANVTIRSNALRIVEFLSKRGFLSSDLP